MSILHNSISNLLRGTVSPALMQNQAGHGAGFILDEGYLRFDHPQEEFRFRLGKHRDLWLSGGLDE